VLTDVLEESMASIFRVEENKKKKSESEPAWAGAKLAVSYLVLLFQVKWIRYILISIYTRTMVFENVHIKF
jgi:hypothetical protein